MMMVMFVTTRPLRWAGIVLMVVVGLLQLHLPHYLAEAWSPVGYMTYPGPVLAAVMIGSVCAAVAIGHNRRFGWGLGIGVATASCVLYLVQETVGLPGLPQAWWEPTRILSVLLAVFFVVLARRQLSACVSPAAR
jgi:hypothetical protein